MAETRRFVDQVVLVTGASRGIGRAIALAFISEGAAVALVGQSRDRVKTVANEIAAMGGRGLPLEADVSREEDVRRVVAQTERTLGPIRILVNNAGISGPTALATDVPVAEWERVLGVNLTGPFLCAREVLKVMIERARRTGDSGKPSRVEGAIVNIGSIAGKTSYPHRSPYAASKWGLVGLTLTLAEEAGPYGIRVNCICPGPVSGQHLQEVIEARARSTGLSVEQVQKKFLSLTMLKRLVYPEDVAAAVLFLASNAAINITGQTLDVAGGSAQMRD
jgi:NAD(P)-dependent dehydrogenase (short-subunit alcohol dehydrogenase family)